MNTNYIKNFSLPKSILDKRDWLVRQKKQEIIDKFLVEEFLKKMTQNEKREFLNLLQTYFEPVVVSTNIKNCTDPK